MLVRALHASETTGAAVLAARGRLVPLPAALRTGAASDQVGRLVDDGERRLRSLFDRLPTRILEESEWRPLDPSGESLRDVDRPEDL
jgi:molybdopterin-guanine dinucleotide biosynthesis protein A